MKIKELLSMEFKNAMEVLSTEKELTFKAKRKIMKIMKYLQEEIDTAFKIYQTSLNGVVEFHDEKPLVKENAHVILEGMELEYHKKNEEYLDQDVVITEAQILHEEEIERTRLTIKDLTAIEKLLA